VESEHGKQNINTTTGSKDLQMVTITLRVLSRPDLDHLPKIYQSLGLDYDERVLPSIGNEVLKSIVAQFDAAELITQREVVGHFQYLPLQMTNYSGRYLHAFGRICLHVQGNSISSSKTCPSHISRLERYVFIN
jgi:SPFH domain / Band 7 family